MKHPIAAILLALLAILPVNRNPLGAQSADNPTGHKLASAGVDWTYISQHVPLDLKWRRHLESNLRWMIARERLQPEKQAPRIVVYADAGTNYQLNGNIVTALESAGIPCLVLDRSRILAAELQNIEATIMPGGYSTFQRNSLGNRGMNTLRQFVKQGGRFLGICAGGYVASRDVHWEKKHYSYPLELFDGTAEGALDSIAAWPTDSGVSLKLTEAGRLRGLT
ncbi:MAG: BPL-N domain-containing protein [Planctomycetota bacterium]|nr:BPL-N domain-containing protein [Planctomycetota bacterium]